MPASSLKKCQLLFPFLRTEDVSLMHEEVMEKENPYSFILTWILSFRL